ncbi:MULTISPECIES: DUF4627 domain-containing protein [Bacteroides]|uniref:DUF4627 domain-containing protein n=1 Tax=Bacteroides TaxID=816 RepID=UPI0004B1189F|nr:DUF4627 domain-containing protein [Bacteroides neonati]
MKKQLFLLAAIATSLAAGAQNLIQNGDFNKSVDVVVTNVNKAVPGEWFIVNNEPDKNATQIELVDGGEAHQGVMQMKTTTSVPWYRVFFGQRIQQTTIEPGVYTLSFDAKGLSKDAVVSVYIKQTVEEKDPASNKFRNTFFVRKQYDPDKQLTHSGASFSQTLKKVDTWTPVTVDYDFGRIINNISSKKSVGDGLQITELSANAPILSDFFVVIQGIAANQTIQVDNVKLIKKGN